MQLAHLILTAKFTFFKEYVPTNALDNHDNHSLGTIALHNEQ